jgi:hypothetical protein
MPLAERHPGVPPRLAQLVERMMAKNPADRFSDPGALLNELHAVAAEGAEQGWAARPDYTSLSEILRAADQRSAATTRLDELMRTAALLRPTRFPRRWAAAAIVGCVLLGMAAAALMRPRSLLADAESGPPPRDTAWAQLYHAKQVDTPGAWRAVITNFPKAGIYYHNLAKQGLAYYYIRTHEYEKAVEPLEQLAGQPDFQAFGIAGLVVVHTNLGDDENAYKANERLTANMRTSLAQQAPQMSELLSKALDELAERPL